MATKRVTHLAIEDGYKKVSPPACGIDKMEGYNEFVSDDLNDVTCAKCKIWLKEWYSNLSEDEKVHFNLDWSGHAFFHILEKLITYRKGDK